MISPFTKLLVKQEACRGCRYLPDAAEKPREATEERSQAFRGRSDPGTPKGYCDSLRFFLKSLLFTTNATAAPACTARPFSFPTCEMGVGGLTKVKPVIPCGPCFAGFCETSPMAYIDILIQDYSKLSLENFTTGLGPIRLLLHPRGHKWDNAG